MLRTGIAGLMAAMVLMWPVQKYDGSFRAQMLPVQIDSHSLFVSRYEVTSTSWLRCYSEGGCTHKITATTLAGLFPATGVNWQDVNQYLKWANDQAGGGLRLPTLAEWRVIDRALVHAKTPPLFTDPRMAWATNYGQEKTIGGPVQRSGSFSTTPDGIGDLDGNVWEWTASCFRSDFGILCPAYVAAGEHEATVSIFVRDPASGGCATGTPPTHLGFRLVADR